MKNNYRKLKLSILLQTVFIAALTVLVGGVILNFVIDGIYNESFGTHFVEFLAYFGVGNKEAANLYWRTFGDNKIFFIAVGFLILFAIFFYISLSKLTRYLDQVGIGIDNVISESKEPIKLTVELKPIELKLNEIKGTLLKQKLEAIESEKNKNDLVLFLAHDLKTPLTSIVAYLTILESNPELSVEERAKYTHISLEKALRLGNLISEFFEITKFNLQNIELEKTQLNLTLMLEQIADELYGVLQEKNLRCEVDVEENLEIYGDPDKLARVFDNLLRNAIAYCSGNTTIRIHAYTIDTGVQVSFSNQGPRIEEKDLNTIFEKFYRVDGSRSSATGGAGLGLAIAKEIVTLHGGDICAQSNEDITKFVVTLPKGDQDEVHTHSGPPSGRKSRRRRGIRRREKKGDLE